MSEPEIGERRWMLYECTETGAHDWQWELVRDETGAAIILDAATAAVAAEACEDLAAAIEGLRRPKPGAREAAADYRAAARALRGEG